MKQCNIDQVRSETVRKVQQSLIGNSTNSVINSLNPNEVLIRYSPDFPFIKTREQAFAVAQTKSEKVNNFYKLPVTSVDTSYSDVVRIAIHPPARLIHNEVNRRLNVNGRDVSINEAANEFIIDGEVYPSLEDALVHFNFQNIDEIIQEQKKYIPLTYLKDNGFSEIPTQEELLAALPKETKDYIQEVRKKTNKDFTVSISTNDFSNYNSSTNNINIDLSEVQVLSQKSGIPFKDVLDITLRHELDHAASVPAIREKYSDLIQPIFDEVKKLQSTNPFDDKYRFSWKDQNGLSYAFQDIYEFWTETNSNPLFVDYLKGIKSDISDKKTLWDKISDIIGQILRQLGLSTTNRDTQLSLWDKLQAIKTEEFNLINQQAIELSPQDLGMTYKEVFAANKSTMFSEVEALLKEESIMRTFLSNVPTALKALTKINKELYNEKRLRNTDNTTESKQLRKALDSLTSIEQDERGNIVNSEGNMRMLLQGIFTVSNTFKSLEQKAVLLSKQPDSNEKLTALYSIKQIAEENKDYIDLMDEMRLQLNLNDDIDDAFIQDYINRNPSTKSPEEQRQHARGVLTSVIKNLKDMLAQPATSNNQIDSIYSKYAPSIMFDLVYKHQSTTQVQRKSTIDKQVTEEQKLLESETRPSRQVAIKEKIKKLELERSNLILPENKILERTMAGEFGDISYLNMMLDSATMSRDVFTTTLSAMIKEQELNVIRNMQEKANTLQVAYDKIKGELNLSNIQMLDLYKSDMMDHLTIYDRVTFNPETKEYEITSHEQKALTSEVPPKYYQEYNLFDRKLKNLEYQIKVDEKTKPELIPILKEEQDRLYKEFNKFREENSKRFYQDEVYELYKLYDTELTFEGVKTTYRKYTNDIYNQRDSAQQLRDDTVSADQWQQQHDIVVQLDLRIKDIGNPLNKTGIDLIIAEHSKKIKELNQKYKEFIITDKARELWTADRENKRVTLGENSVAFKIWDQENSTLALNLPFLERRNEVLERLKDARQTLIDKKILEDKPNTSWETILNVTKKARDNSRIVDGNLIPEDEVQVVKDIEELELSLKEDTTSISALSKREYERLKELRSRSISPEEKEELKKLQDKQAQLKGNKDLPEVKQYLAILKELGDLTTSEETPYYQERVSKEKGTIQSRIVDSKEYKDLIKAILDGTEEYTLEPGRTLRYSTDDNEWYKDTERNGRVKTEKITDGEQRILNHMVQQAYTKSEWYLNNHIEKTVYKKGKYVLDMVPLYIWTQKTPKAELFGAPVFEPGFAYKTSRIKESFKNTDYKETLDGIPFPTKLKNEKYERLKKNKTKFDFYTGVLNTYLESQVDGKRLGFLLPSGRKLEIEDLKGAFEGGIMNSISEHLSRTFGKTDQDIDILGATHDSVLKRIIPTKLSSRIEAKDQTDDILGNIMQYVFFAERKKELTKLQALSETVYDTLSKTDKTALVTSSTGLNPIRTIKNLWKGIPNNQQATVQTQTGVESNRTKSIRELIDKQLYGQNNKGQDIMIGGLNFTKATNSLLGLTARSIFAWNIFSPLKNTIGAGVQQIIEANAKLGYFSDRSLAWGQKETLANAKNLTEDSFKFGDKSLQGQMLDLFDAVVGHTYDHFGRKTLWNKITKSRDFFFMSLLKEGSEYNLQITQFFAVMKHTIVKLNGNNIPLYEAYQLGSDGKGGTIQLKPGVTKQDGTPFSTDDQNRLARTIQKINYELNGGYRNEEKNNSEKYLAGKVLNFMSRYLVSGINRRYMANRYIEQDGTFQKGYYRTAGKFLLESLTKYRLDVAANWSSLTNAEKANVQKFMRELLIMVTFIGLIAALGGGDDDRFDKSDLQQFTIALLKGSNAEVQTFSPINGTDDMLRRIQNPFIVSRTLQNIWRLTAHTSQTIYGDEDAFYKQKGPGHDKGDSKALVDLMKLAGMGTSNVFFGSGEELLRRQESILQLR